MLYNLFYLANPSYGGWIAFTAHLSLKHNLQVYKIGNNTEQKQRPFGYDVTYRNIAIDDINCIKHPLIVAVDKNHYDILQYFPNNTWIVIHDPSEVTKKDAPVLLTHLKRFRIITIRKSVQEYLKKTHNLNSLFLIHPFFEFEFSRSSHPDKAVSVARIDFDKHTDIILKANQYLPLSKAIDLYGFANRQYVHFKLNDLNFKQYYKGTFEKSFASLNNIMRDAKFSVDMSVIKHDGGGTQYTFLESIYQNVAIVINKKWVDGYDTPFKNGVNCYVVETPEDLARLIKQDPLTANITKNAKKILAPHIEIDWISELDNASRHLRNRTTRKKNRNTQ